MLINLSRNEQQEEGFYSTDKLVAAMIKILL